MAEQKEFEIKVVRDHDYRMVVEFDLEKASDLVLDEPEPLGGGEGPNPSRALAAAVGTCLSSSLVFCLSKSRVEVGALETTVRARIERNEAGRWRVAGMQVKIHPDIAEGDRARIQRCLGLFEDFCIVTESVRKGIDVDVEVVGLD